MKAYYNEIDPFAAEWLRQLIATGNIAPGDVDTRSIEDVTPYDLRGYAQCHFFAGIGGWSYALRIAGWPDDRPVWTGSCPCQPFSAAGQGTGFTDERHLWPSFFHLIEVGRPHIILGEQVGSPDGLKWLDLVQNDLQGTGYSVRAEDRCAAGVGAPHIRQRLYWMAHSDREGCFRGSDYGSGQILGSMLGPAFERPSGFRAVEFMADTASVGSGTGLSNVGSRLARETDRTDGSDPDLMADAAGARSLPGSFPGVHSREEGAGARDAELERLSAISYLEYATGDGREQRWTEPSRGSATSGCSDSGLDNAIGARLEGHSGDGNGVSQPGWVEAHEAGPVAEESVLSGMADTFGRHLQKQERGPEGRDGAAAIDAEAGLPGPVNGFWRASDWLHCRDGKWRPVEPSTFPLANGIPNRVGLLRGYGNAIVPQVAATFVRDMDLI